MNTIYHNLTGMKYKYQFPIRRYRDHLSRHLSHLKAKMSERWRNAEVRSDRLQCYRINYAVETAAVENNVDIIIHCKRRTSRNTTKRLLVNE